jgi:hypothetical protein
VGNIGDDLQSLAASTTCRRRGPVGNLTFWPCASWDRRAGVVAIEVGVEEPTLLGVGLDAEAGRSLGKLALLPAVLAA